MNKLYIDQSLYLKNTFWILEEYQVFNTRNNYYVIEVNKEKVREQILNEDCLVLEYN